MKRDDLIKEAIKAMDYSYSPYSNFKVGAALLTKKGVVYHGANIENASYGLCSCGERNAIFNAYCHGVNKKDIEALAIVAKGERPVSPCGACRQVISELCPKGTKIYLANTEGKVLEKTIEDLLPYSFEANDMDI